MGSRVRCAKLVLILTPFVHVQKLLQLLIKKTKLTTQNLSLSVGEVLVWQQLLEPFKLVKKSSSLKNSQQSAETLSALVVQWMHLTLLGKIHFLLILVKLTICKNFMTLMSQLLTLNSYQISVLLRLKLKNTSKTQLTSLTQNFSTASKLILAVNAKTSKVMKFTETTNSFAS